MQDHNHGPDPLIQGMMEDLSERIARQAVEMSEWRTRAIMAEKFIAEMRARAEQAEAEEADDDDNLVELHPEE